jgi:hypothetical protein
MTNIGQMVLDLIRRGVWFPVDEAYPVLTSYLAMCAAVRELDPFEAIPYLAFTGQDGSGKTETCALLATLADGEVASSISRAALFRWTDLHPGCLLAADEAAHLGRDLDDLLKSGYRRGGKTFRCDPQTLQPIPFNTFGPKVLASVQLHLPPPLLRRTIPVEFYRAPMEFIPQRNAEEEMRARNSLMAWARAEEKTIRQTHERWRSDISGVFVEQRERQIWAPLLAVGEIVGLLDPLKTYLDTVRRVREHRQDLRHREQLDAAVALLPADLEAQGIRGLVPFAHIREYIRPRFDGDQPSDKAIAAAVIRRGFRRVEVQGGTAYEPPHRIFGRLFGR